MRREMRDDQLKKWEWITIFLITFMLALIFTK